MRGTVRWGTGALGVLLMLALAGLVYEAWAARALAERFPPPGQLLSIGSHRLHLECAGKGSPTVVVEAGAGSWSVDWHGVRDRLSGVTRVCLYDRAGYGWSEPGPGPRPADRLAAELDRLLDASGESGPYVLAGHSLGGWVVRLYRERRPGRVAGIALIDAAHEEQFDRLPPEVGAFLDESVDRLEVAGLMARVGLVRLLAAVTADSGAEVEQTALKRAQSLRPSWFTTMAAESRSARRSAVLVAKAGDLGDLPLLVLSAGRSFDAFRGSNEIPYERADSVWLELQAELSGLSTRARHRVHRDASHRLYADAPGWVAEELAAFVRAVRSGRWRAMQDAWSVEAFRRTEVCNGRLATGPRARPSEPPAVSRPTELRPDPRG